jgi:hypothetical protein
MTKTASKQVCSGAALCFDPLQPHEIAGRMKEVLDFAPVKNPLDILCWQCQWGMPARKDFKKSQSQSVIISQDRAFPKSPSRTSHSHATVQLRGASIGPKRFT